MGTKDMHDLMTLAVFLLEFDKARKTGNADQVCSPVVRFV